MYKEKVDVCSEISTKHSTQSENNEEFFKFWILFVRKETASLKRLTLTLIEDICKGCIYPRVIG
jgi:hypothetical protein